MREHAKQQTKTDALRSVIKIDLIAVINADKYATKVKNVKISHVKHKY